MDHAGCQCQGCRNAGIANTCTENLSESETASEDNSSSDEECITTEIVTDFDEIIYSATINVIDTNQYSFISIFTVQIIYCMLLIGFS